LASGKNSVQKFGPNNKSVLKMSASEAKKYFLKSSTFVPMQLPTYFKFDEVLKEAEELLRGNSLINLANEKKALSSTAEVNYTVLMNKNGRYDWRPVQIVHPIAYVDLVNIITSSWEPIVNRFKEFQKDTHIECISIPSESQSDKSDTAETILNWWEYLEQNSIKNALLYKYCVKTDVTNCYGSIYTHTIAWALHGKEFAKMHQKHGIGNEIDKAIEHMQNNQTNGIPQGGPLFDFIAEMVLGYSDLCLAKELIDLKSDYKIIRYRDDYRIFANSKEVADRIIKSLSEVLADLNMHFNSKKTDLTDDIIGTAVKKDKLFWTKRKQIIFTKNSDLGLQKHLWQIYELSSKFPNSGSVSVALIDFLKRLNADKKLSYDYQQLISIVSNIMLMSPRSIPQEVAVLGNIFNRLEDTKEVALFINNIMKKFKGIPNTGYVEIWLQRLSLLINRDHRYSEPLCQKVYDKIEIWNSSWLKNGFDESTVIDNKVIDDLTMIIPRKEVDAFSKY
jgi:hypothetical protein